MGNNNVTGQQEEPTHAIDKIIKPSNDSPGLNSTDDNKKEDTQDEQVASDKKYSSPTIEGADAENRGSIQDNTSIQDDQSDNTSNKDHELVKDVATERTTNPTEIVTTVSTTIEEVISINDSLVSSEKNKQLENGTRDRVGKSTVVISTALLDEHLEGLLEDGEEPRWHENALMGDNLVGKDSNEILEKGHIAVSTIEDHVMAMQGEITTSTESIVSNYLDADDSEIKEVVIEDNTGQRDRPSYAQPLDVANIEIFRGYTTEIQQEKEEITAIITTTTKEPMIESDKIIEEGNPEYSACQVEQELEKHEIKERLVSSRKISDSVTPTVVVDKTLEVHNLVEFFEREMEPEEHGAQFVSPLEAARNLACLPSSYHLVTVNEGNEKRVNGILERDKDKVEIQEQGTVEINAKGLGQHINAHVAAKGGGNVCNLPMIIPSTPVLLLEDFDKMGCIQPDSSDINEGTITSTYGRRAIESQPQDTIASSQRDQSQWQLIEEPKVVKLEDCEILTSCVQLDGDSLKLDNILTDDCNYERAGSTATPIGFTIQSNQEGDTTTTEVADFIVEGDEVQVTAGVDKVIENQYHIQMLTTMSKSSEEIPLLQRAESIGSFCNSTEQNSKEGMGKSVADISAMQCKAEAEEESEKSPLLSPRDPSGKDFRVPNHSARKIKPFQNLLTEGRAGMFSPLKEQKSVPTENNFRVNSPRGKGKQKTRSSLFSNCMCCVTPAN